MGEEKQENSDVKLQATSAAKGRLLLGPLRALHKAVVTIEPWGIFIVVVGFFISIAGFILELDDRQSERTFRAWEVILSSRGKGGSGSSVRKALEYLNREFKGRLCGEWGRYVSTVLSGNEDRTCLLPKKKKESFANVDLNKATLYRATLNGAILIKTNLRGADLSWADFSGANLLWADLSGADLSEAKLIGASFSEAKLTGADLSGADLNWARFSEANLTGVDFSRANLSWADLSSAMGLERAQLMTACADPEAPPILPDDFKDVELKPCPEKE